MKKGSIAIYGTSKCGHGYIACAEGMEPPFFESMGINPETNVHPERSATSALWLGLKDLREKAGVDGPIEVTIDTDAGPKMVLVAPGAMPTFGALKWGEGRVYTISAEDIIAASEKEG